MAAFQTVTKAQLGTCDGTRSQNQKANDRKLFMANYIIIGGDGKEYGPVTDADVRQWIAEGRLSAGIAGEGGERRGVSRAGAIPGNFATALHPAGAGGSFAPPRGDAWNGRAELGGEC